MSVAEKTAVSNFSKIRGKIRSVTAFAVMGVLIVMVLPRSAMARDLVIIQNSALLVGSLLVPQSVLQRLSFSGFPSLFLFINTLFCRCRTAELTYSIG
jgi:flagellar biosynthesis component FlhA